ncbi:MAG: 23S rRNA (pseudouridine(1915)-N(3))-methyltransferase RlmH [Tissierellia bacterium]|nr:23S rRNA (pseudouridine(1915)-N(3))-methyltransferase RlmH [Tissierellia bacterium]
MKIKIIAVGKIKENYLKEALAEYKKRMTPYSQLEIIEVKDQEAPEKLSQKEKDQVMEKEAQDILKHIGDKDQVISLEIKGKSLDSLQLADYIKDQQVQGYSTLTFVIGGSLGLAPALSQRAQLRLSFSKMTFPHQLMRVILLEQIYRSFRIIHGHSYHK